MRLLTCSTPTKTGNLITTNLRYSQIGGPACLCWSTSSSHFLVLGASTASQCNATSTLIYCRMFLRGVGWHGAACLESSCECGNQVAFRALGFEVKKLEVQRILREYDPDTPEHHRHIDARAFTDAVTASVYLRIGFCSVCCPDLRVCRCFRTVLQGRPSLKRHAAI
jgi:hypothetical protein